MQPRFAVTCTEKLLRSAAEYAREKDLTVHTHASENRTEVDLVRSRTGSGNIAYLETVGLLTTRTCLAHAVHLEEGDASRLAAAGTSVVHCPSSNLKLSSGICRVTDLRSAGVRVALGSDGAACNDHLDPFREMRLAALLSRIATPSRPLIAFDALQMTTWQGARALRLPGEEGLMTGGRADLVLLDPEAGWSMPHGWSTDPYAAIVYSMGRENVYATVVDGVVRYRAGDPSVMGLKPAPSEVREAVEKLKSRM